MWVPMWIRFCTNARNKRASITKGLLSELILFKILGSEKYSTSNIFCLRLFGALGYVIPDPDNLGIMKLRLRKIKCAD